jgi:hypothetical protein
MGRLDRMGSYGKTLTFPPCPNNMNLMSIWNKVLVGLILIATLGFTYQATVYLKISELCREEVQKQEAELAKVENENHVLREADDEAVRPGIRWTEVRLHQLLANRGRVWYHCEPRPGNAQEGGPETAVAIATPDPHGIALKAVLYAFEETPAKDGGRYVGEYVVTSVDDDNNQVVLTPTTTLSQKEAANLAKSPAKGPWTLYDTMPLDGHDTFAKMDDEEKKASLPDSTEDEYIKDGKPAKADDPKELKDDDGNYVRRLRNYEVLFRDFKNRCVTLIDQIAVVTRDNVYLDAALADAGEQVKAELTVERDGYRRDVSVQTSHQKVLQDKLAGIQKSILRMIAKNHTLAEEISRIQLAARDRIDAKTRRLANTGARPE